jgi:hypothetical protein
MEIVNRRTAEPQSAHDHFWALSVLNTGYRAFAKLCQDIVLKLSAIYFFHGRAYTTHTRNCLYYYGLINNTKKIVSLHCRCEEKQNLRVQRAAA